LPKLSIFPKDISFITLFEKSAHISVGAAQQLQEMLQHWGESAKYLSVITELEHQGDTITHEIIAQLHSTFITPFDREDIALLAHSLDDVTDYIEATADSMILYKVQKPTDKALELSVNMVNITKEVEKAISEMHKSINLKKILERCIEINRLENESDMVYRSALAGLFSDEADIAFIIKWREIYEYMESAVDSCEDIANVLEGVALKYT
jgi:predicted phosphate transport protein (TIGR00153 family)